MPSTHYTDFVGPPVSADWLNAVDAATFITVPGLVAGSITTQPANSSVTTAKFAPTAKAPYAGAADTAATAASATAIADGAVSTSAKLIDGVVTPAKLSTGAPTWTSGGALTTTGKLTVPTGSSAANLGIQFGSSTTGLWSYDVVIGDGLKVVVNGVVQATFGDVFGWNDIGRSWCITGSTGSSPVASVNWVQDRFNLDNDTQPAYVCRAWVNFNGVPASGTYGRSGTTVTVTMTAHGLTTGMVANLTFAAGTGGTATSGSYPVTVVNANTFTITDTVSGTITGSPVATRNVYIRASGNVSSITDNGVGDYTVNFTTAMPDSNYAFFGSSRSPTDSTSGYSPGMYPFLSDAKTTTTIRLRSYNTNQTAQDSSECNVVIFR